MNKVCVEFNILTVIFFHYSPKKFLEKQLYYCITLQVHRALLDNPHLHVPDYIDVFVAVSQLVADTDVGIASKAILVTSHLPKGAYPKVLEEMKIALKLNSSSKCNALEVSLNFVYFKLMCDTCTCTILYSLFTLFLDCD